MDRTMSIFLNDSQFADYVFTEKEIGAPNTRDCFTLAAQMLACMGVRADTQVEAWLFDGIRVLAHDTFGVPNAEEEQQ